MYSKRWRICMKDNILSNIVYLIKRTWKIDKCLVVLTFLKIPITVVLPLLITYLSKCVVELVTDNCDIPVLFLHISLISAVMLLLHLGDRFLDAKIQWRSFGNRFNYLDAYNQKVMSIDYEQLETPNIQDKIQRAFNAILGDESGTQQIFAQIVSIMSSLIGLITYSIILLSLNPMIMLLLFLMTILNYFISNKVNIWQHKNKDQWVSLDRKLDYIKRASSDLGLAKDVRLFSMTKWLDNLFDKFLSERVFWWKKSELYGFCLDMVIAVINLIRNGIAYGVLIYYISIGFLSAADFVWYFNVIAQYSTWLMGIVSAYSALQNTSLSVSDLRAFLEIRDKSNIDFEESLPDAAPDIVFRNVSFKYPSSDNYALKNISFSINKGEKLAIVGLNGAGKTTLIKLLSGLYTPTVGEIYIDGKNITRYNINKYYSLFSIVFQDILFIPVSVAKNISLCDDKDIDLNKLKNVIKDAGLLEKVESLPQKERTLLCKSIHFNAIDFSGGENKN